MSWITSPEAWLGLLTLTVLEIVLGIDNIIFISILAGKLPVEQQGRARRVGLLGAMLTRIALLAALAWIIRLTAPRFQLLGHPFSGRDLILIGGGLFLIQRDLLVRAHLCSLIGQRPLGRAALRKQERRKK